MDLSVAKPEHGLLCSDGKQRRVHEELESFTEQDGRADAPAPEGDEPDPAPQRDAPFNGTDARHGAPCRETPNNRASCKPR